MKNHFLFLVVSAFSIAATSASAASLIGTRKVNLDWGWYNIDVELNGSPTSYVRLGTDCDVILKDFDVYASEGHWEDLIYKGPGLYETKTAKTLHVTKARIRVRSRYSQQCELSLYDNVLPQEPVDAGELKMVDLKPKHMDSLGPCLAGFVKEELQKKEMPVMKVKSVAFPTTSSNDTLYFKTIVEEGLGLQKSYWITLQTKGLGAQWKYYSSSVVIGGVTYKDEGYKADTINTVAYILATDGSLAPFARFSTSTCWNQAF